MSSTLVLQFFLCGMLVFITVLQAMPLENPASIPASYTDNQFQANLMNKRAINPFMDSIGKRSGGVRYPIFRPSNVRRTQQRPFDEQLFQQQWMLN